jgi:hypothetical protein
VIDETKVNYPPQIKSSYSDEIKERIENIKKPHKKFGKKNIESAWGPLVNKNPGILSKHKAFRTDDGVFLSNLIQTAMEMQNIEEGMEEEERDEENKEYMMKLYNGEIEFDELDIQDDELTDSDDDDDEEEEDESNIARLLNMFDETETELIEEYEKENSESQRVEQSSQTI